jgi:hypothetical protein
VLVHDVSNIEGGKYTRPTIPALRTSADGRIALSLNSLSNETTNATGYQLYVIEPEAVTAPFTLSPSTIVPFSPPSTTTALSGPELFKLSSDDTTLDAGVTAHDYGGMTTICDTSLYRGVAGADGGTDTATPASERTPVACDASGTPTANGANDCYFLTLVGTFSYTTAAGASYYQLRSRQVEVVVTHPKTAQAQISQVSYVTPTLEPSTPLAGTVFPINRFFEPMITSDGRLIVARIGHAMLRWTRKTAPATTYNANYELVYAYNKAGDPCDVTQWTTLYPILYAQSDPDIVSRYEFAKYPFRDTENAPLPDDEDLEGTYSWIDRGGRLLFFAGINPTLDYGTDNCPDGGAGGLHTLCTNTQAKVQRFPSACVPGVASCENNFGLDQEDSTNRHGLFVMGLWTHGKAVLLDGMTNPTDYGMGEGDSDNRIIGLYDEAAGPDCATNPYCAPAQSGAPAAFGVRVGTGMNSNALDITDGPGVPQVFTGNLKFTDSLENLFDFNPNMKPVTPRDVVWLVNTGSTSDEVVFDDYLDNNALIVSEMTGSATFRAPNPNPAVTTQLVYNDGFQAFTQFSPSSATSDVRVQNSATSTIWHLPPYGLVTNAGGASRARLEPIALGGVHGRGLWLFDNSNVTYNVPAQSTQPASLFVSLFVDPRELPTTSDLQLVTFPGGGAMALKSATQIDVFGDGGTTLLTSFTFPAGLALHYRTWSNLAFQWTESTETLSLFFNGYLVESKAGLTGFHPIPTSGGAMELGHSSRYPANKGFQGWLDDFKVLAETPTPEVACNHARGTLIRVGSNTAWQATAALYAGSGSAGSAENAALASALGDPAGTTYACYVDYASVVGANLGQIPTGSTSVRQSLLFGGPTVSIVWNEPRPDFSHDAFCLSCHTEPTTTVPSLSVAALVAGTTPMYLDLRRRPLDPPYLLFGNFPDGLNDDSGSGATFVAPVGGTYTDPYTSP